MSKPNEAEEYKKISFDFEALEECPFCQEKVMIPNGKIKWLEIDMWYVICPACGLKYMNPRPTRESYQDFYKNLFWQQKVRNLGFHQEGQMWQAKKYKWDNEKIWDPEEGVKNRMHKQHEQKTKDILAVLEANAAVNETSAVLDVGCSFGVTLDEIHKKYKCKVYGIEPSSEARAQAEQFNEIEWLGYYAEELEGISKKDTKFDVLIFSHVLENTTEPVKIVGWAKDCLKPGGMIYIQCANLLVFDQMNPYHPFIFSRNSLRVLAERVGLQYKSVSEMKNKMLEVLLIKD